MALADWDNVYNLIEKFLSGVYNSLEDIISPITDTFTYFSSWIIGLSNLATWILSISFFLLIVIESFICIFSWFSSSRIQTFMMSNYILFKSIVTVIYEVLNFVVKLLPYPK